MATDNLAMTIPDLPAGFDARSEFPILKHWDFFNHAGVAPISQRAVTALARYARQARDHAYLGGEWYAQAETVRALCARLINAQPDEIAYIKNTSEGLAFVANGLEWKRGDEIVTSGVEYPANIYPWMDLAARLGVKHVMVPEREGRIDPAEIIAALTPRTRMLSLSHVEYASGFRNDLAALGAFCRERGILFCVDAIQTLGALPVDVQAMKIDFLAADGHKWMLAPEGCGFFYCRRELLGALRPEIGWWNVVDASNYGHYDFTLRCDARRFECGTYSIPGILALGASLELLLEVGIDLVGRRVLGLTERLCEGLRAEGCRIISSRRPGEASGIVSFEHPALDHKQIVQRLQERKIVIVMREGRLRASPHFYNSPEQIDALLAALP